MFYRAISVASIAFATLSACGEGTRPEGPRCEAPPANLTTLSAIPSPASPAEAFAQDLSLSVPLPSVGRFSTRSRQELNILVASTGGQWAAFGAGFLKGWMERPIDPMPRFAVATGASAGAYVAPFAILGPDYKAGLSRLRVIDNQDTITANPFFGLFGASVYRTDKLKDLIGDVLDQDAIDALAARGDQNLYVGAVDLDSTAFQHFNLTRWSRAPSGRDCVIEAILASSAIPVVFPPRVINGELWSDAGLRDHVFLTGFESFVTTARQRNPNLTVNVYAILNGDLGVDEIDTPFTAIGVAGRSISIATDDGFRASVIALLNLADARGFNVFAISGKDFEQSTDAEDPELPFDGAFTAQLFDYGYGLSQHPQIPWMRERELRMLADTLQ